MMAARAGTADDQPKLHLRHAAPLSPEMRVSLAQLRDEAYADGKLDGRREVEREYYGNGLISFGIGSFAGAGLLWFLMRVFA